METIEAIDRECAALGGLFQQVVNDMKIGVPHYEDFISKAGKLHGHLKNTIMALGSFLDTFQKIADAATNTKGATREIGACLTRIVIRHKAMEARMKTLSSALLDCLVLPLAEKMEEWRKVAAHLDKEHSKEYKKLRQELKKKTDNQHRLVKKHNKKSIKEQPVYDPKVDQGLADVTKSVRCLHEVEKAAVRRVLVEERSRYCTFVACLKPVLGEEVSLVSELQQLEEVCTKLDKHTEDPFKLPEASEQVLCDIKGGEGAPLPPVSYSPPSSPSSLGSRKSSMCSISSAGSSSGGSVNSPSHQGQGVGHRARHSQGPLAPPLRLSSISSQDSGFTSQDTLFLRPGDPHPAPDSSSLSSGGETPCHPWGLQQGMSGPPITDRPHTISSAYEKGHQRPSLQAYTFNPPDKTIPEEEEVGQEPSCRPPVPQRLTSMERPSLPGKTEGVQAARMKLQAQGTQVPSFSCQQPDMVVPQPVYMNMDDLASLAGQREDSCEEGLDLKTPTQEDQTGLSSGCSTSDGSSGYGSQSTVLGETGYTDGCPARQTSCPSSGSQPSRPPLLRPYSFTPGVPTGRHGVTSNRGGILRRSSSQSSSRPPALARGRGEEEPGPGEQGSNTSTPRGSMEFLPPPPPHLLCSDEEDEGAKLSVADSVRKLSLQQQQQGRGPSPSSLRRVQSMTAATSSLPQDRQLIMKRLDAALASPRGRGVSPHPPQEQWRGGPPSQDQIYAPVAALQQKIQQQQKQRLLQHGEQGHPRLQDPGPIYATTPPPQQLPHKHSSPEGEQYGFGMQFQQRQQLQRPFQQQHPQQQQYQQHQQQPQQQQQQQQYNQQQNQHQQYQQQQQQQQQQQYQQQQYYNDHLMSAVDPALAQRPRPPQVQHNGVGWQGVAPGGGPGVVHGGGPGGGHGQQEQVAAALRVRQWIETRTVSDVRKIRPVLNQEIHQGFLLKKNAAVNDRSVPRF